MNGKKNKRSPAELQARSEEHAPPAPPADREPPARPAALYARMSTEHQQYSTENQTDKIREYAQAHDLVITKVYTDEGKSGLTLEGRGALTQLIEDVQAPKPDFDVILVYDISRWGRFQDADESAYYEYICRRAGIDVIYCAEQFANDGSPMATIYKGVKRAMAGEYSRELSSKVFIGQCRLVQLGFHQGGPAGFGLRRMLIDIRGTPKGVLAAGEQKSIQTDRVVLTPGPDDEVEVVRQIFELFVRQGQLEREIAQNLNERGIATDLGVAWTRSTVHQILTNEKYIGNNVYNRISFKLKKRRVRNPPKMWIRAEGAFPAIVDPGLFQQARERILERARQLSDDELLTKLRELREKHGCLSALIINEDESAPSSSVYQYRFGSLIRAYERIGYTPERDYEYLEVNRRLRQLHPDIVRDTLEKMRSLGAEVTFEDATGMAVVNGEFSLLLVLARCQRTCGGSYRWNIRLNQQPRPDITVAIRMDEPNQQPLDYYLLPTMDLTEDKLRLAEDNGLYFDAYRFDGLDYLFGMAERTRMRWTHE